MREYIVLSGRLVPAPGVVRGPLLLGDQESWFRSIRTTTLSVIGRQMVLIVGMLLAFPVLIFFMDAPGGLFLFLSGIPLGIILLFIPLIYLAWVSPMVNGYRRLGLSPGPYAKGMELPCILTAMPMVLPQTKTVFVPYPEIADVRIRRGPWTWCLQDTVNIWFRNGKRLRVPTRFLGDDGVAILREALARGPAPVGAPRLVLYGPSSWDGPRPMPEGRAPQEPDGSDRG